MPAEVPPGSRPLARQLAQSSLRAVLRPRDRPAGSHPAVARALLDHSSVYEDPWSRAARTTGYALRFGFGEDRDETATELRALHRGIGGVDDAGRRYHAWDRDVWTRVHLTTAESLLRRRRQVRPVAAPRPRGLLRGHPADRPALRPALGVGSGLLKVLDQEIIHRGARRLLPCGHAHFGR